MLYVIYRGGKGNGQSEVTSKKTPKFLVSRDRDSFDKEANWENEPGK